MSGGDDDMGGFDVSKCPFPWFGGKSKAAPAVWEALGDVPHYVEPFAGSLAVLVNRPHEPNRTYFSETVNDLDGFVCNFWRSIRLSPGATAEAASWPVSEADLHARHLRLLRWREENDLDRLMGSPGWHDPVMAGWWAWGLCCWIGAGWHGAKFADAGWREVEWFAAGFLTGGMGNQSADGTQQHRERLWCSPHCLAPAPEEDRCPLFSGLGDGA